MKTKSQKSARPRLLTEIENMIQPSMPAREAVLGAENFVDPGSLFTGRYLVLLPESGGTSAKLKTLTDASGVSVASTGDFAEGWSGLDSLGGAEALFFSELGVAVVDAPPDKTQALMAAAGEESGQGIIVEPERYVFPIDERDYFRGYRDGVNDLTRRILNPGGSEPGSDLGGASQPAPAAMQVTWGLQAAKADVSSRNGAGVRVAVLDTGIDRQHPDFVGRAITSQSFVNGEDEQDVLGHGTHCIGTACGPRLVSAPNTPRYGIAWQAEIFVGKIFDRITRRAPDSRILAGIEAAMRQGCAVVSMSLGAPVSVNAPFNAVMEQAAARALAKGVLIIAAAGNDSRRPGDVRPVSHPANCPSIMAVAAVDSNMRVAPFSNGGLNPNGGKIDLAGPGVGVFSSWPMPTRYNTLSGTSMATPHVAGCAALHAQAGDLRGGALWARLLQTARALPLSSSDVGGGLVQAPL